MSALSQNKEGLKEFGFHTNSSQLLEKTIFFVLVVMLFLLPIQRFELPLNMEVVDPWNFLLFFVIWVYVLKQKKMLSFPYILPWWLIILANLISLFSANNVIAGLIAILQEVYLYAWFLVLVLAFDLLNEKRTKTFLKFWLWITVLHGVFLIAQFISPEFLKTTTAFVSKYQASGSPRPLGLMTNPNMAANFQLLGIVPLLLLGRVKNGIPVGILLVFSVFVTGSLGASIAVLVAFVVVTLCLLVFSSHIKYRFWTVVFFLVTLAIIGILGYLLINVRPDFVNRFDFILYGRFDDSLAKRTLIWQEGMRISSGRFLGIGVGNFKDSTFGVGVHNDLMAFWVERGILGVIGVVWLGYKIVIMPLKGLLISRQKPQILWPNIVFLSTTIAFLVESATHEIFHFRFVWLVIALQQSMLASMKAQE